jgi:23S rRNA (uracil1939-C5)-methyltransferase
MPEETLSCRIDTLSYGIFGVARTDRGVVLVPDTAPGDLVRIRIVADKRDYREGEVVEILEESPARRSPPCPFLPECGGCTWQHVDYPAQLAAKEAILRDSLVRLGGFDPDTLDLKPILSFEEWAYRHRVTLRVDGEQRLGFYRHRSHRLVEIDHCLIADETVNAHLATARQWLRGVSTNVKRVEIADAGEGRVVFAGNCEGAFRQDGEYHEAFLRRTPGVGGIILFGSGWRRSFGDPRVEVEIGTGLSLETQGGFTQVNPAANRRLVEVVLELAAPRSGDRALELFCGAGNFTLPIARRVGAIVGVESDPTAIGDARRNADRLGLGNCRFVQQDAAAAVKGFVAGGERFSLVLLDPPRSGAAAVVGQLSVLAPERVVYVSCNPTTLARDLEVLASSGFALRTLQPLDLFPQTHHLESVAVLHLPASPSPAASRRPLPLGTRR